MFLLENGVQCREVARQLPEWVFAAAPSMTQCSENKTSFLS